MTAITWLAPGATVNDAGEMVKKLPLCVSVIAAEAVPTFESVKLSVAPDAPVASSMPPGNMPTITRAPAPVTVTVVVAVAVPPCPFAVSVYVVVWVGETLTLPDAFCVPTPLSMETDPAWIVDQESVDELPAVIVEGFAEKLEIAGPGVPVDDRVSVNVVDSPG